MKKYVNVLGTKYTVNFSAVKDDDKLEELDGYCDWTTRTIVVQREMCGTLGDMDAYVKQVLRHEILHAFLHESGLSVSSVGIDAWALNEEMVDWLAIQGPKIVTAWQEVGAL